MPRRQVMVGRIATVLLCGALAAASPGWAQAAGDAELDALRRQVLGPLRGRCRCARASPWSAVDRSRRVEIVDGLVLDAGTPLSGAELRERLGADAGLGPAPQLSRQRRAASPVRAAGGRRSASGGGAARRRRRPHPRPHRARPSPHPRPHRGRLTRGLARSEPVPSAAPPEPPVVPTRTFRRSGVRLALGKSVNVGRGRGGHRRRGRPRRATSASPAACATRSWPSAATWSCCRRPMSVATSPPSAARSGSRRAPGTPGRSIASPSMPGAGSAGRRWGGRGSTSAARRGG